VIVLVASNLGAAETLAEETAQPARAPWCAAQPTARTLTEADAAVTPFEADCDLLRVLAALRHGGHDAPAGPCSSPARRPPSTPPGARARIRRAPRRS
jgi:hypothetical protein